MEFVVNAYELRLALKDIERAEKNGFDYCLAVFKLVSTGPCLDDCRAEYSDLCEKAHPTDGNLDWGRFQGVTKRHRFINGELKPLGED